MELRKGLSNEGLEKRGRLKVAVGEKLVVQNARFSDGASPAAPRAVAASEPEDSARAEEELVAQEAPVWTKEKTADSEALPEVKLGPCDSDPEKELTRFNVRIEKGAQKLGLGLMYSLPGEELVVTQLKSTGAIHEWNQRHPERCICVGDLIVAVNKKTEGLKEELQIAGHELRLTVQRQFRTTPR